MVYITSSIKSSSTSMSGSVFTDISTVTVIFLIRHYRLN